MFQIAVYGEDIEYTKECGNIIINTIEEKEDIITVDLIKTEEDLFEFSKKSDETSFVFLHAKDDMLHIIDLSIQLKNQVPNVEIIFIAEQHYFDFRIFEVQPYYFIRKQYLMVEINKVVNNIYGSYLKRTELFEYTYNKKLYRLDVSSILYLESRGHVVHIVTEKDIYRCYRKLDSIEQDLSKFRHRFIRIHKSYCINTRAIEIYSNEKVTLVNGKEISISKSRRKQIKDL